MLRIGTLSGVNATIAGGPYDGVNANEWAHYHFLPSAAARIIGIAAAVAIGIWEFCAFFPAEIVIWQRVSKRGLPSRSSFAPWTTLILRYLMLCFSVSTAFINWSTTMSSDDACRAAGGFTFASWNALVIVCAFAIAWRAQAVARGVIQKPTTARLMQVLIGVLVLLQVFITLFTSVWSGVRENSFWTTAIDGQCNAQPSSSSSASTDYMIPRSKQRYYEDPMLWFWVFNIIFNLACLIIVLVSLRTLAARSRGFSKLITGIRNHSVFYFVIVSALSILGIVWVKVEDASWVIRPTTVVQAAIMIRILLAEQNAARRPMDTTYMDHHGPSRHFSTRGGLPTTTWGGGGAGGASAAVRGPNDTTIHFVDRMHLDPAAGAAGAHGESQAHPGSLSTPTAVAMRPIYQPYSMMDNLGQAFSHVDSRNPHDLDGQSVVHSQDEECSFDLPPNIYPGVFAMEERERRLQAEKQSTTVTMYCANSNGHVESDADGKQDQEQSSSDKDVSDSSQQSGKNDRETHGDANALPSNIRRRDARPSHAHHSDGEANGIDDDDDDDDDEGIGISTVHF